MSEHPYVMFEGCANWHILQKAIESLVENRDLIEQTDRHYIVGYLCKALEESNREEVRGDEPIAESLHNNFEHVYPILRYDHREENGDIRESVTIVKVLTERDAAEAEAIRLRNINDETKCIYDVQVTRLVRNMRGQQSNAN